MIEHSIIICKCENVEHQLVFTYFSEDREVYMTTHLKPESNIFKRIWRAIKYIFGYRSMYGDFDEFIFNKTDSHKLAKILKHLDPNINLADIKN